MNVLIKVGTAGRGQIPSDVRKSMKIEEGDVLIVDIKRIIKSEVPA